MNRADLQKLTGMRLSDAKRLLKSRRNDAGAYYMAGYAIECALKACIAGKSGVYPFPAYIKEADLRLSYYTHDLKALLKTAELDVAFGQARGSDPALDACWIIIVRWDETVRYETRISRQRAEEIINAIEDPIHGVLIWLKRHW